MACNENNCAGCSPRLDAVCSSDPLTRSEPQHLGEKWTCVCACLCKCE